MSGLRDSDRYFTSPEILGLVAEQWPDGIDLDPCHDELCIVSATTKYNIRKGEDGLILPWIGKVWCNPPYSNTEPWLARAAQHGVAGGEVLVIVNASTGTRGWRLHVWPHATVCFLSPRPKFRGLHCDKPSDNPKDSAVLYYGPHVEDFTRVWRKRGTIASAMSLRTCPQTPDVQVT